jgi:rod shape determining protein RodA
MKLAQIKQHFRRKDSGTQNRTIWQVIHLDYPLLILLCILCIFGLFILYSASNEDSHMVISQTAHFVAGLLILFICAQIPPWVYKRWAPIFYGFCVFSLFVVLITGRITLGAQRWINLGIIKFQPSDLTKIAIPLVLAWFFSNRVLPPKFKDIIVAGLIILIPAAFTMKEPDLGSAIILVISGASVLLLAGLSWRLVVAVFGLMLVSAPILWHFMHGYQKLRILTFLNPQRDPLGAGYHIIQSKIAIGSGGVFGKGWLHGTQSHLHFLPEHATDFIFAVSGEEFGLIGCLILLVLYIAISLRCFYIASQAQNTFTRLLAGSLGLLFFMSVFVNMGMVSGILPVVGLPLPLVSYGGTSMITLLAGFGILMSIHTHKKLL